jgi:histidinol-phosphatase
VTPPPNDNLTDDLTLALELADGADAISLGRFRAADLDVSTKPDRTFVTDADRAVEHAIREGVARMRPYDSFYGEESGTTGTATRQWIIDPIDGTSNFLRGVPVWGTLIALAVDGVPVLGVVSAPALGKRWWAATGSGAWLTRRVWRDRAFGDMWSYMLLAEGLIDITGEFDVKPYDLAALIPIVEEAGGRFSSIDGREGPWHGTALATNGPLHEATLALLNAATPRPEA